MKPARSSEAGYALLFVYALAASVAIMLYMQLPNVIFEAQRDKEQLLIDRGEQYSRAVQLYVRKYNRFPIDMDALEKTQGLRFLRRKYVDPMTGKAEWRLIHVGPGGVFTDSLVHNPKKTDKNAPQSFITEMQQIGGNAPAAAQGVNLGARTRPSDQGGAPGQGSAGSGETTSGPVNNGPVMVLPDGRIVPANTSGQFPQPGQGQPGRPLQPGQFPGQPLQPVQAGQPIQPGQPVQPVQPGQPVQVGQPGFNGVQTPNGIAVQPGGAGAPPNAAANLINNILTTPRPQGGPGAPVDQLGNALSQQGGFGAQQSASSGGLGGQAVGGGFAGVASKVEQEGIKVYGERTAYNEWEFVYDMSKDPMRANANRQLGQVGQQGSVPGQPGAAGQTGAAGGQAGFPGQSANPSQPGQGLQQPVIVPPSRISQ